MHYHITHRTQYLYNEPVSLSHNILLLTPRTTRFQQLNRFETRIDPKPSLMEEMSDRFGNSKRYFEIHESHEVLNITARSEVTTCRRDLSILERSMPWEQVVRRLREDRDAKSILNRLFLLVSPLAEPGKAILDFVTPSFPPGRPVLEAVWDLTGRIHQGFRYAPGSTEISTPLHEVMKRREGVCQDFAHLQIAALRLMGLAACYVSGYLETRPPPGQPRLVGADASHAWIAVRIPDLGWIPFDPTNNVVAGESHIMVACGRDYSDVAPVSGIIIGGSHHTLEVSVDVLPVPENAFHGSGKT
ncbi:MAG: transglutaminase family protein [Magnetococcales bacterium]|nr:transglutaminase family protein [Magnetococcales bacterium]